MAKTINILAPRAATIAASVKMLTKYKIIATATVASKLCILYNVVSWCSHKRFINYVHNHFLPTNLPYYYGDTG
jgi:hypothetical protein